MMVEDSVSKEIYMKKKFMISSHDKKLKLSVYLEGPDSENEIKAVIQFSHGMSEHKERYLDFIHFLSRNGYLCVIHDHRGHGDSVKSKRDYGYFYDETGTEIVKDLHKVTRWIKSRYPDKDIYMFAHSMGTLAARIYLQTYDNEIRKLVLCGPPCYNKGAYPGYRIAKFMTAIYGTHHRSSLIQKLAIDSYNKKCHTHMKNGWINSDTGEVEKYNNDPKCGFVFTLNGFMNLFSMVKNCFGKNRYRLKNKELPILMIAGSDDPVIGGECNFKKEAYFLLDLGYENLWYILYPHLRHELLNERKRDRIYKDVLGFYRR